MSNSSATFEQTATDEAMAGAIRALTLDAVAAANSGHSGMPMGMADAALALYRDHLKFDASAPEWADRDRFILSTGHGSMLMYSLLYLTGTAGIDLDDIKNFRQIGSKTPGHPEVGHTRGVETTTGPLGQGIANAVGFAIAEARLAEQHGSDLVDHHTYCIAGDGCLMEGVGQEAITLAGHLKLNKLIVLFDDNGISIDGPTSLTTSEDHRARFDAAGWNTMGVDGHDVDAVSAAIGEAKNSDRPTMIACKTTIAYGSPTFANTSKGHGAITKPDDVAAAKAQLDWPHGPFEIPADVLNDWRAIGGFGADAHVAWQKRVNGSPNKQAFEFQLSEEINPEALTTLAAFKRQLLEDKPKLATRASSGKVLDVLVPKMPALLGGSADLTGSNLTKAGTQNAISAGDFSGSYLYYGIREHAMAAAMNGIALHGGFIPYGGTFLVFTDYCRPSIRLSALMNKKVIYVMSHDSIGLGEDGPTHQPVEHIASLRAIPNLRVFRPCDAMEVAESWELALTHDGPSVLALSRQNLPMLRSSVENITAYGGYLMAEAGADRHATILATGSEVEIAMDARALLAAEDINVAVASIPCWELFNAQPQHYRDEVLGPGVLRVAVEAGIRMGWDQYIGRQGGFVGMDSFGASGPGPDLYGHFGITAQAVADEVKARL